MGEAGLLLVRANLRIALQAPQAGTAAAHEGNGDPLTHRPAHDLGADCGDHTSEFVTGHVGEANLFVTCPGVPIAAAQPSGFDLHDHPVFRGSGFSDLADFGLAADRIKNDCTHSCHCA